VRAFSLRPMGEGPVVRALTFHYPRLMPEHLPRYA